MKSTFKLTTLLATLVLLTTACEKPENPTGNGSNNSDPKERTIVYAVGENENRTTLRNEGEWDVLLDQFCKQAQEGSEVVFYNMNQTTYLQSKGTSKTNRTITTTSRDEMKQWMKDMEKQGLTVRVTYNDSTGTWHGEAYATAPTTNTNDMIIGTWRLNCMVVTQTDENDQLVNSDLFAPLEGSTMYYSFYNDGSMTISIVNSIDSVTDSGTWRLTSDGELSSEMLPNGVNWNVNWISPYSMILSRSDLGTDNGNYFYQLQFDAVTTTKKYKKYAHL